MTQDPEIAVLQNEIADLRRRLADLTKHSRAVEDKLYEATSIADQYRERLASAREQLGWRT